MNKKLITLGVGIVNLSVCVPEDMPVDDVLDEANLTNPTGLEWGWSISTDEHFATGQTNPCPCEKIPGRVHRLLHC